MTIWNSVKAGASAAASKAATASKLAAHKAKLHADIVLCDREIIGCKKAFGVSMYDHISPLSQSADFYAASDELTEILRPSLIVSQKEVQALAAKRVKLKEQLATAEIKRATAFPTPAENAGQKVLNFGKASAMHSIETKIKAEISMTDSLIKGHKQDFGLNLFGILVEAEDKKGYLPTDRQVRTIYDQTRQDIQKIMLKKKTKTEELAALGESAPTNTEISQPESNNSNSDNALAFADNQDPDLLLL
jgi:hypothetical protein